MYMYYTNPCLKDFRVLHLWLLSHQLQNPDSGVDQKLKIRVFRIIRFAHNSFDIDVYLYE